MEFVLFARVSFSKLRISRVLQGRDETDHPEHPKMLVVVIACFYMVGIIYWSGIA